VLLLVLVIVLALVFWTNRKRTSTSGNRREG